ncbi:hypothetical protein [Oligoflexus tunisiensis]|uniref:hypothetical protein n=1 Tax=Oligoflexus tunisiensis TaxID=708132 RepID=UPI00159F1F8E|nr:hypothetical protein [Oligoflexus tunisiensis]
MLRCLLALGLALAPAVAFSSGVETCSFLNNADLKEIFGAKSFNGQFRSNGKEIQTFVELKGDSGKFKRGGAPGRDNLPCIRYLSVEQMRELASATGGFDIDSYFSDPDSCVAGIAAEWTASGAKGRVLWCVPSYVKGAKIEGVYWQNADWRDPKYTDIWNGRW